MMLIFWSSLAVTSGLRAESPGSSDGPIVDARAQDLKTLDGHFPFLVPEDAPAWRVRAEELRRRVLVATGLWPLPVKTPLNPVIHGRVERDGFTVEKVYFESLPGHYVTGLLFRPTASSSPRRPGVLSPHGHGGRLQRFSDKDLASQIAQGAEHFQQSGRMPKIARCAQLARMGCVTFIFDMIGYADSVQISQTVAHRYADATFEATSEARAEATADGWGFYSPQAELRLQSIMGLQTWNAIRSLDFLASLPDVDSDRLAVTGGSGGGTQTILLGAIDDRVKVGFPNGMVSTSMQGGCYCENCNLLRIDTGNVELAALFAPRPQAMTAADDWTKRMMSDGYPELQQLYRMIGDVSDVYCRPMLNFKHNYNYVTRATMYQWMNRHLNLGLDDPVIEQDFQPLSDAEMAVWDADHPRPAESGMLHQQNVCRWFDQQATDKLTAIEPQDKKTLQQFRSTVGQAWSVIFDQGLPESTTYHVISSMQRQGLNIEQGLVRAADRECILPLLTVRKPDTDSNRILIWTDKAGKSVAFNGAGDPSDLLTKLVNSGNTVLLPDLYHQGDLQADGVAQNDQRLIDDKRPYSAFTFGYNRTAVVQRSADLLAVVAHAEEQQPDSVRLLGTGSAALWAVPAAVLAGSVIDDFAIDNGDSRFANVTSYRDVNFVPGGVKYGDLPALVALRAPHSITVASSEPMPSVVWQAFDAAGQPNSIQWQAFANHDESLIAWSSK